MKKITTVSLCLIFVAAFSFATRSLTAVENLKPTEESSTIEIDSLSPSWDEKTNVYSAYYGPWNNYVHGVSPGHTDYYDDSCDSDPQTRDAGIIKAGIYPDPGGGYWDEGLFAFKPTQTINDFADGDFDLSYDVVNESGDNPVWMTIELDATTTTEGIGTSINDGDRNNNTTFQFIPKGYGEKCWHSVNVAANLEDNWERWTNNAGTVADGYSSLSGIAGIYPNANVVRVYLRLGMGSDYHDNDFGTVGWVDKVTIGDVTYDFVVGSGEHLETGNTSRKHLNP